MRQINAQKSNSALVKDKPVTIGVVTLPADYMSTANFKTLKAKYSSMLTKVAAQYSASGSGEERGGPEEQDDALAYVCESSNICGSNLTLLLEGSHDGTAEKALGPGLPIDVGGVTGSSLSSRMLSSGLTEGLDIETSSLLAREASASLKPTSSVGDIISAVGGDEASAKAADKTEAAYEEAEQTVQEGKAAEADLSTELQQEKQIETQIKEEDHTNNSTRKTTSEGQDQQR